MAADPAEAERGRGLVLLARDRLDRPTGRFRDLSASPEDQAERRTGDRAEPVVDYRSGRKRVIDEENRDEDRQASPDLDVETDQSLERPEANRQQRPEEYPDDRAPDHR